MDYDEWKEDFGYEQDAGMTIAEHNQIMENYKHDTAEMVREIIHVFRGDIELNTGEFRKLMQSLEKHLDTRF